MMTIIYLLPGIIITFYRQIIIVDNVRTISTEPFEREIERPGGNAGHAESSRDHRSCRLVIHTIESIFIIISLARLMYIDNNYRIKKKSLRHSKRQNETCARDSASFGVVK